MGAPIDERVSRGQASERAVCVCEAVSGHAADCRRVPARTPPPPPPRHNGTVTSESTCLIQFRSICSGLSKTGVCVECLSLRSSSRAPYRTPPACTKRASYPDPRSRLRSNVHPAAESTRYCSPLVASSLALALSVSHEVCVLTPSAVHTSSALDFCRIRLCRRRACVLLQRRQ